jgi:hypothetical protein
VPAKLRVHQEPRQPLCVISGEPEALEGAGKTPAQVVDPHQPRGVTPVVDHDASQTSGGY